MDVSMVSDTWLTGYPEIGGIKDQAQQCPRIWCRKATYQEIMLSLGDGNLSGESRVESDIVSDGRLAVKS